MKITITIDTGNDAFFPGGAYRPQPEVIRILRELAESFDRGHWGETKLRDYNGNTVGAVKMTGK